MRPLVLVLLCSLAGDALALRGRPVSNHRFEGNIGPNGPAIASDGSGFLVRGPEYVQKVENGQPVGPIVPTGVHYDDLAWAGTHYLAVNSRWIARLSREGSLLGDPVEVFTAAGEGSIVAGTSSALAFDRTFSDLRVRPVTLDGQPTGPERIIAPPPYASVSPIVPQLAAAGGRFLAAMPAQTGPELFLLRPDGTIEHQLGIPLPATHNSLSTPVAASDGTDFVVAFTSGRSDGTVPVTLVTAVVGVDGTVRRRTEIQNIAGAPVRLGMISMLWAGSQYFVMASDLSDLSTVSRPVTLLRLTRDGEVAGGLVPVPPHVRGWDFAWNGSELTVVSDTGLSAVDAAFRVSPPAKLGRALSEQRPLALGAGPGSYLAAWTERDDGTSTLRASRIDAAGNYLDGDGIVVDTGNPNFTAVDGKGPHWLVAWSAGNEVRTRTISFAGVPGAILTAGAGVPVDLLWRGSNYVLLRRVDHDIHADTLRPDGTVQATRVVVAETAGGYAQDPHLLPLDDRLLMVYEATTQFCHMFCIEFRTLSALSLDPVETTPVVIDAEVGADLHDVASDGERGLVVWTNGRLYGAFLTDGQPGPRFELHHEFTRPLVAHDGSGFVLVMGSFIKPMRTGRIQPDGSLTGLTEAIREGFLEPADLAGGPALPPLALYRLSSGVYRSPRAALLFTSEFAPPSAVPPAPQIVCATENADGTITVRWNPASNALGVSIQLQLSDGTFREIAVAAAGATSARVSRAGLAGNALRLRAWNALGLSDPSAIAPARSGPQATLRNAARTCPGRPLVIDYTLTGVAPFTVRWSDGFVQSNLPASASRTVTVSRDVTLSIVSVSDASSCGVSETVRSIRILVDPAARIDSQPREVQIPRGQTATLTIEADDDLDFAWFEGNRGDTSKPVGTNDPSFTTPALQATTRYWVRVSSRCGAVESDPIVVVVTGGKGRAVRK